MKTHLILTFIMLLFTYCGKNYQSNLTEHLLTGEWFYSTTDSLHWVEPQTDASHWNKITIPADYFAGGKPPLQGRVWFRKYFVLMGHFVENLLYINLGKSSVITKVIVNGKFEARNDIVAFYFSSDDSSEAIFEIDRHWLHYGKPNLLAVEAVFTGSEKSIFPGKPGIYTRLSYLKSKGLNVKTAHFQVEQELHARLEDFSQDWEKADSLALIGYFVANFKKRESKKIQFINYLLQKLRELKPLDIELSRAVYYQLTDTQAVWVLADWLLHLPDGKKVEIPFHWLFKKRKNQWLLKAIEF